MLPDSSFIQKLRMNSIFPSSGGNPTPLIGMPDFNSGRQQFMQPMDSGQSNAGLRQIGQRIDDQPITKPITQQQVFGDQYGLDINSRPQNKPMNFAYDAPESDKYATNILMGTTEEDKHRRTKELLNTKTAGTRATAQGTLAIKQQLANIAKFKAEHPGLKAITTKGGNVQLMNPLTGEMIDTGVDTGTLTEQDKIELAGDEARETEDVKQTGRLDIQKAKGNQALEQIGARVAGQKDVAGQKPISFTQQGAQNNNNIKQMMLTRPDLATYVTQDKGGRISINPDTPLAAVAEINKMVYGDKSVDTTKDINLPSTTTSKTSSKILSSGDKSTDKTAKPTAAELLKKYGG